MTQSMADLVVRKSLPLACSVEHAFTTFTERIAEWWPLATHSLGHEQAVGAVFEGLRGGRIYEVWDDGQEREWGQVLVYEPPHRLVYSWRPNPDRPAPTEVEVRFLADGDGARVELEHRGWERLGEQATDAHRGYDTGWDTVLGVYAAHAGG